VRWEEEQATLTLEGEPVLEYALRWPQVENGGFGGRWISRYYAAMARAWRLRWRREVYWQACLELAARRGQSRPFVPWTGRLEGEVTLLEGDLLSLRLEGEEIRGDGKSCRVRWGDTWKVREGAPCLPGEVLGGERRWKKTLREQILRQGRERQAAGDWFPDGDWERKVKGRLPVHSLCLTEEGAEIAYPQCSIAPAAEGTPVFILRTYITIEQK